MQFRPVIVPALEFFVNPEETCGVDRTPSGAGSRTRVARTPPAAGWRVRLLSFAVCNPQWTMVSGDWGQVKNSFERADTELRQSARQWKCTDRAAYNPYPITSSY